MSFKPQLNVSLVVPSARILEGVLRVSYDVCTYGSLDSILLSLALDHTHSHGIDRNARWPHHWMNQWSCSPRLSSLQKLLEGSSTVASVIECVEESAPTV